MNNIDFEQELYKHFGQVKDFTLGMRIGKYFYELGKQSGSSEIPNDLEEAAGEYEKNHTYQRYDGGGLTPEYDATLAEAFIAGAKWLKEQDDKVLSEKIAAAYQLGIAHQKEQMMKEAVEKTVCLVPSLVGPKMFTTSIELSADELKGFKPGDKVRVIVLPKED